MARKKKKLRTLSADVTVFKILSLIFCVLSILFLSLNIATSKNSIKKLTIKFVSGVDIEKSYYNNYTDYGFTSEICDTFFTDDRMINIVSDVMADKMYVLYKYADNYSYKREECQEDVRCLVAEYAETYNLSLDDAAINTITAMTCDITGITQMYVYDSPAAYRDSIFNSDPEKYASFDSILKGIAALSKIEIAIAFMFMYVVCLIILVVLYLYKNKDYQKLGIILGDTSLIPALVLLGFSLGKIAISPDSTGIQNYIFGVLSKVSIIFVLVGFCLLVSVLFIGKKCSEDANKENPK